MFGKAEGTGWALSDFAALAGVGDFLDPGSQEASEAGPSHLASVLGRIPALPAWPPRCRGALRVRILSLLHHKLALCFSPPTLDFKHRITVQASPGLDRRRNVFEVGAGDSPTFPRFRAIQCKQLLLLPTSFSPDLTLSSNLILGSGSLALPPPLPPCSQVPSPSI